MPPAIVPAPSLVAPRFGLLTSATDRSSEDPAARWMAGLTWSPESCGEGGTVGVCDDNAKTLNDANPGEASFRPFSIWQGYKCSTFGPDEAERERRVRALLAVHQSALVEAAFWTGEYADGDDTAKYEDNDFLRNAEVVEVLSPGDSSSPLVYALGALEEAMGFCGGRGMIHASVPTVELWAAAQVIRREANLWLTPFDNIVVPGSGYDGSSPAGVIDATGETAWAYTTGMIDVRLGPIRILGGPAETGVDRLQNDWETRAERLVAVTTDPCCRFGIRVNLCSTYCDPQ